MKITCMATLDNQPQIDNLMECIKILGGKPEHILERVVVSYEGDEESCDKFFELFEHYNRHTILVIP